MINFRSSSLVVAMALAGLTLSTQISALPAEPVTGVKAIKIKAGEGSAATVVARINGEDFLIELPKQALADKEALEAALSDFPENIRASVSTALADVELGEHKLKLRQLIIDAKDSAKGLVKLNLSGDSGQDRVIAVDVDETGQGLSHYKFIGLKDDLSADKFIKVISNGHKGKAVGKETIMHLLSAADLTAQELDEIQQALDKKR